MVFLKKIISLFSAFLLCVLTSGCLNVNSYAVRELNQIASEYLEIGDIKSAIARLESSIDLDDKIYESHYNLAVAYLRIDECKKALEQVEIAKNMVKNEPAIFYTLGVANSCTASQIYEKKDEKGEIQKVVFDNEIQEYQMGKKYIEYLEKANENYKKYVKMLPNAEDTQGVMEQIKINQAEIETRKAYYKEVK